MLGNQSLEKSIVGFAGYARDKGFKIAVSEVKDALKAVEVVNPTNIQQFKEALAYCVVKDINNAQNYDQLFSEYFFRKEDKELLVATALFSLNNKQAISREEEGIEKQENPQKWKEVLQSANIPEAFKLFISGKTEMAGVRLIKNPLTTANKKELLDIILREALKGNIKQAEQEEITQALQEFNELSKTIQKVTVSRHRPEPIFGKNAVQVKIPDFNIPQDLLQKELGEERQALRQALDSVARQVHIRMAKQLGISRQKKILNYRNTIKQSIKTFGEPFRLVRCANKQRMRKLVTICDISGSVKYASELLLAFMYELHQIFNGKAHHHIFVGALDNVTNFFEESSFDECFNRLMTESKIDHRGYSNYNTAFSSFVADYNQLVDYNTVVIIVGDGRNNKNDPGLRSLQTIKDKAHTVLWINPENPEKWNKADSMVGQYERVVDRMVDVSRFGKLLKFLYDLPVMIITK